MDELKRVFTVHELNEYVDLALGIDPNLKGLAVEGELGSITRRSGMLFFTLKDETAAVNCVMFRPALNGLRFLPKEGQRVRLTGTPTLYAKEGRFQLIASGLMLKGEGSLFAAFVAYKEELNRRGWFDATQKKPIPLLPKAIGLVTSATGSVRHDVETITERRFPSMPVILYPTSVQGEGAAREIAAAIDRADAEKRCDVLIVGRGGGSMEDLWAFNEKEVAEAIHRCSIPVISSVGHETDFSISDFVADLRAPTPSAAAELAVPERDALEASLSSLNDRLQHALENGMHRKNDRLRLLWGDAIRLRMHRAIEQKLVAINESHTSLSLLCTQAAERLRHSLDREKERLFAYSLQRTLERGFALIENSKQTIVTAVDQIETGETVSIRFADGMAQAEIAGKERL